MGEEQDEQPDGEEPMTTISRRSVLTGASGLAGLLALSACGAGGESGSAGGEANLRMGWWGNDVRVKVTDEALRLFESRNEGVTVRGESGNFDNYFDRLATQVAGQDAPDVFQMNEWNLREYADRGALLDLSEHGFTDAEWPEGSNGTGVVDGKVYGATAGVGLQGVMVNPDVFEDAGLDVPDGLTWSWEDYHAIGKEISGATKNGVIGASFAGGDQISAAFWSGQQGNLVFDAGKLTEDPSSLASWFSYWLEVVTDGTSLSAAATAEQSGVPIEQQAFSLGSVAMQIIPVNVVIQYESTMGQELTLLRLPTQTGKKEDLGMWYRASQLFCASSRSKFADESGALINFLLNDVDAGKILLADRGTPPNTTVLEAIVDDLTPGDQRVIDYMNACEPDLVPAPEPPPAGAGAWTAALGRAAEDVMFERTAPEAAAEALLAELREGMQA